MGAWAVDDFYITYRYALNLATGQGFVFNPGERVFGTTDPGLGLLLALLRWLSGVPVEWLASGLFALCLVACAMLVARSAAREGFLPEALLGGTLVVASSLFWVNNGAAAPCALLLLLAAAGLAGTRPGLSGLAAGIAVWVRPDSGLAVLGLGVLELARARRIPWRLALTAGAVILAGLGVAWLYFGTPLPGTLGAKASMAVAEEGSWAGPLRFWLRARVPLERHLGEAWPVLVAVGLAGQVLLWRRAGPAGRILSLHGLGLGFAYPFLGVPFFGWYILPAVAALLYGVAFSLGATVRWLLETCRRRSWLGASFAGAGSLLLLVALSGPPARSWAFYRTFEPTPHLVSYRSAAEWLRRNTLATARVAYVEIGVLGYYSDRHLVDLLGLVKPELVPFVRQGDLVGAFLAEPVDYVVFHTRGRMGPIVSQPWFSERYLAVARFEDPGGRGALSVFEARQLQAGAPSRMPRP